MQPLLRRLIIGCVCFIIVGGLFGFGLGSPPLTTHAAGLSCPHLIVDDSHNPYRVDINECFIKLLTLGVAATEFGAKVTELLVPEFKAFSEIPAVALSGLIALAGVAALKHYDDLCSKHGIWIVLDPKVWNWHLFSPDAGVLCSPVPPVSHVDGLEFYDNFAHLKSVEDANNWTQSGSVDQNQREACTFSYHDGTYTALTVQGRDDNSTLISSCGRNTPYIPFANAGHGMLIDIQYFTRGLHVNPFVKNADIEYSFTLFQKNSTLPTMIVFSPITGKYHIVGCMPYIGKPTSKPHNTCITYISGTSSQLMSPYGQVKDLAVSMQDQKFTVYSTTIGARTSASYLRPSPTDNWERIASVDVPRTNGTGDIYLNMGTLVMGLSSYSSLSFTSVRVWQLT